MYSGILAAVQQSSYSVNEREAIQYSHLNSIRMNIRKYGIDKFYSTPNNAKS